MRGAESVVMITLWLEIMKIVDNSFIVGNPIQTHPQKIPCIVGSPH